MLLMPASDRTFVAAVSAILLVGIARALLSFGGNFGGACAIIVLFPGMAINLLTRGVHGSWDDPLAEVVMVGVPALGWFIVIRLALAFMATKPSHQARKSKG